MSLASQNMSQSQPPSYLVVGAGVFGTSTALHLKSKYPGADVTLVDRHDPDAPTRPAASWDWNKVVRADYRDITYCRTLLVALEAQDRWRTSPLWSPYYHETGIYWISRTGFAQQVVDNFKALSRDAELYALPVEEARKLYGGIFDNADYEGVDKVLINKTSGWAAAKDALQAGIKRAISLGVKFVTAEVEQLEFDYEHCCVGVRIDESRTITADRTILCTGAFTPVLLERSADKISRDALRPKGRMIAAGVTTGLVTLDEKTVKTFEDMPVCIQENPTHRGPSNGTLPPNNENQLKFWGQSIFQLPSGTPSFSQPPTGPDYQQWEVPATLKTDVAVASEATFGKRGTNWKIHTHRICWDCVTPNDDFIISPHSASTGLFIATCGSFHGWKFLPVIGDYVVQMLDDTLEPELKRKWAWDRPIPKTPGREWPRYDLRELINAAK
ncbi:sarcosine oxidase [Xylaria curta]|nr:sarcosine oxidase [Xylaria curta]